jgi:hypothetical protein
VRGEEMSNEKNEKLYQKAMVAINELFSDTSVSQEECRENLQTLIADIEMLVGMLDE